MFRPLIPSGASRHLPLVSKGRLCVSADLAWFASGGTAFLHGQKSGEKRAAKEGCFRAPLWKHPAASAIIGLCGIRRLTAVLPTVHNPSAGRDFVAATAAGCGTHCIL